MPNEKEIVFEVKYKLSLFDSIIVNPLTLLVSIVFLWAIYNTPFNPIMSPIFIILFSVNIYIRLKLMFYERKNRLYITSYGIGFERRHWFKMQKGFFKFGEVGIFLNPMFFHYFCMPKRRFIIYSIDLTIKPMMFFYMRDKNYKYYILCDISAYLEPQYFADMLIFIRQKTKEALEAKGISISNEELKEKIRGVNMQLGLQEI